jgi:hypothetical protein
MRCSAEPIDEYTKKAGAVAETAGRKCLCNALFSVIGLGQRRRSGYEELPLMTSGDQLATMGPFLAEFGASYSAIDVVEYLTSECETPQVEETLSTDEAVGCSCS